MVLEEPEHDGTDHRFFVTTRWSLVLAAKDRTSPASAEALETLCRVYWYPLYAFVRGCGHSPPDAQDLTQGFFEQLLSKNYLRMVQPEKGRFRSFLRMALKRFMAKEWERGRAEKRGGGHRPLAFDTSLAEQRLQQEPATTLPPDVIYDRHWALTLLGEAMERLERECAASGRAAEWFQFRPHLTAERGEIPYADIAAALQTTEGAARVAVHRLRKRFRVLFREMIADTVAAPEEIDPELRHVLAALAS